MVMTATPQILKEMRLCAVLLENVAMDFLFNDQTTALWFDL